MEGYKWYFPINAEGGQPEGLNDSGVESFRGNQIESLAREIIQNSTDARWDNDHPVKVTFNKFSVDLTKDFPDKDGLQSSFKSCSTYKRTPEDAKLFFNKGLNILEQREISILRISDFNTTGLKGVNTEASDWENLVKSVGISNKGGSSGGSFGIGKSAPFACSDLRTVFYNTINIDGERGFQGVSRLASHERNQEETRSTGFYGIGKGAKPIINSADFPNWYNRNEFGTDVYVAAFLKDKKWKEKVITAVIENFFIAIFEENLVVEVEDVRIDASNLKSLIDEYIKPRKELFANEYFSTVLLGEQTRTDIEDLGEVELYLLKGDEFSKKVALVRNTGMKITHMDRFMGGMKFSGVLIIRGSKLNQLLRKTEPPAHDKWEPSRHSEPAFAEKTIKRMQRFVRDAVKSMNKANDSVKIDFKGFNKFLPDHLNEEKSLEDNGLEENDNEFVPKSMKISVRRNKKENRTKIANNKGGKSSNSRVKRNEKRNSGKPNTANRGKNLIVTQIRSIIVNEIEGIYDLKISTSNGGKGKIELNFIGEDARSYKANIISAIDTNTQEQILVENGFIGPIEFNNNTKRNIRVILEEKLRASLEVIVNEG